MADVVKTVEKEMEHKGVFFLVKVEYIVTDTDHDLQITIHKYNDEIGRASCRERV